MTSFDILPTETATSYIFDFSDEANEPFNSNLETMDIFWKI